MDYQQQNITYPGTYGVYGGTPPPLNQGQTTGTGGPGYEPFRSAPNVNYNALNTVPGDQHMSPRGWNNQNTRNSWGGGGSRGRGRGGRKAPPPKKQFSCSNKHPVAALKSLRPNAKFVMVCSYASNKGSALVYTVTIDDVVYQGEATSGQIARAIAATKALAGINAFEHQQVQKVADYDEQKQLVLERIAAWQESQAAKEKAKKAKEEQDKLREQKKQLKADKDAAQLEQSIKKMKDNDGEPLDMGNMLKDLLLLQRMYGPDITCDVVECQEKNAQGAPQFSCEVVVQGTKFSGIASSKKAAKRFALARAFDELEKNPPPVVNDITKKRKVAKRNKQNLIEFKPIEPIEFQDKLAEKCWNFVSEMLAEVPDVFTRRRNLVVVVKVTGEDTLDNCEVVAFGNGTLTVKQDKLNGDGLVIEDSTGESLALRALRRYLLDNVESGLKNDPTSIFEKKRGGKLALKPSIAFYMYTNSAPVGDCRAVHLDEAQLSGLSPAKPADPANPANPANPDNPAPLVSTTTEAGADQKVTPMETDSTTENKPNPNPNWERRRPVAFWKKPRNTPVEDLGKLTVFKEIPNRDVPNEVTILPTADIGEGTFIPIPSPSDKLAMRQVVGIQGGMLSNLIQPVFISKYLIGRSYHEPALVRALRSRIIPGLQPEFLQVRWKVTKMAESISKYAIIWCKGYSLDVIYTIAGQKIDLSQEIDPNDMGKLATTVTPSEYCTKLLYQQYESLCKAHKKSVSKYHVIKSSGIKYHQEKKAAIEHFRSTGMGEWPVKGIQPSF